MRNHRCGKVWHNSILQGLGVVPWLALLLCATKAHVSNHMLGMGSGPHGPQPPAPLGRKHVIRTARLCRNPTNPPTLPRLSPRYCHSAISPPELLSYLGRHSLAALAVENRVLMAAACDRIGTVVVGVLALSGHRGLENDPCEG